MKRDVLAAIFVAIVCAADSGLSAASAPLLPTEVPLIPRVKFFGNPDKARARISPDGSRLAYLAPRNGVLNVWVAPVNDLGSAKPVTNDTHRGIRNFFWAYTNRHVLYLQDKDGDEDFHVYSVDLEASAGRLISGTRILKLDEAPVLNGKQRFLPCTFPAAQYNKGVMYSCIGFYYVFGFWFTRLGRGAGGVM